MLGAIGQDQDDERQKEFATPLPLEAVAIPQLSSASISLIASVTMAIMITRSERGLSTPYRRIILGLSIADILQSSACFLSPFTVPHDVISDAVMDIPELSLTSTHIWAIGNDATCRATAYVLATGISAVQMYICFICFYYLCKLKYRMNNDTFRDKYEWKIHTFIILYNLCMSSLALGLDLFHTRTTMFCYVAEQPFGCRRHPDIVGECDPVIERRVRLFVYLDMVSFTVILLVGIFGIMVMLNCHVRALDRVHSPIPIEIPTSTAPIIISSSSNMNRTTGGGESLNNSDQTINAEVQRLNHNNEGVVDGGEGQGHHQQQQQQPQQLPDMHQYLSSVYRKETLLQAFYYIGGFCIVYIPPYLAALLYRYIYPAPWLQVSSFLLFPLGGLFNILIYTRPQVSTLRRDFPEYSWVYCFYCVLKAGGDLPLRRSRTNHDTAPHDNDLLDHAVADADAGANDESSTAQSRPWGIETNNLNRDEVVSSLGPPTSPRQLNESSRSSSSNSISKGIIDLDRLGIGSVRGIFTNGEEGLGSGVHVGKDVDVGADVCAESASVPTTSRKAQDDHDSDKSATKSGTNAKRDSSFSLPPDFESIDTPPAVFSQVLLSSNLDTSDASNGNTYCRNDDDDDHKMRRHEGGQMQTEVMDTENRTMVEDGNAADTSGSNQNGIDSSNNNESGGAFPPNFVAVGDMNSMDVSSYGSHSVVASSFRSMRRR